MSTEQDTQDIEERRLQIADQRAERFARAAEHFGDYYCTTPLGPDPSTPGAGKIAVVMNRSVMTVLRHPRYMLVELGDNGDLFVNAADSVPAIEKMVRAGIEGFGHKPLCYLDLDELDGDPPIMMEAEYEGERWIVHGYEYEGGVQNPNVIVLKQTPKDRRRTSYDWTNAQLDELENVVYSHEDERLPVRYDLAQLVIVPVFNTMPTRSED